MFRESSAPCGWDAMRHRRTHVDTVYICFSSCSCLTVLRNLFFFNWLPESSVLYRKVTKPTLPDFSFCGGFMAPNVIDLGEYSVNAGKERCVLVLDRIFYRWHFGQVGYGVV